MLIYVPIERSAAEVWCILDSSVISGMFADLSFIWTPAADQFKLASIPSSFSWISLMTESFIFEYFVNVLISLING